MITFALFYFYFWTKFKEFKFKVILVCSFFFLTHDAFYAPLSSCLLLTFMFQSYVAYFVYFLFHTED